VKEEELFRGLLQLQCVSFKMINHTPATSESVRAVLARCQISLIADWSTAANHIPELNHHELSDEQRTEHLPKLVEDLMVRLKQTRVALADGDSPVSPAAVAMASCESSKAIPPPADP
jgi:hypothetical protein